jgi:RNA polymerase sigma factor (sigma-70 family)
MTERQLLEQFITGNDQDAFRALIDRHGSTVLGICRSVLRESHDVEDAFQMTFLILARDAGTIRERDCIGPWLRKVALRLARKERSKAFGRRALERLDARPAWEPASENLNLDLLPVLRAELSRLPERYRLPLVLCYLEGKTTEEAAMQLGCPVGTVKGRLSRARERLRDRFCCRGLTLLHGT